MKIVTNEQEGIFDRLGKWFALKRASSMRVFSPEKHPEVPEETPATRPLNWFLWCLWLFWRHRQMTIQVKSLFH
jgi:hypothetical protein